MGPVSVTSKRLLHHGGSDASRIRDAGRFLEGHGAVVPRRLRRGGGGRALGLSPLSRQVVASSQGGRPRREPGQLRRARRRGHRRIPPPAMRGSSTGADAVVVHGRSGMQHLSVIPHVGRSICSTVSCLADDRYALVRAHACEGRLAWLATRECVVSACLAYWVGQACRGRGKLKAEQADE